MSSDGLLPIRGEGFVDRWGLTDLREMAGATCSQVFAARREGRSVVLKVPLDPEEATSGLTAMLAFQGHGAAEVLDYDRESGAVLMAKAEPGAMLHEVVQDEAEATRIMAHAILQLRQAPMAACGPVRKWHDALRCDIDHPFVAEATAISEELFATSPRPVLLHGDLHHYNLLQDGNRWVVIDPKGVVGDPAFESAAYLRNPVEFPHEPELAVRLKRRIDVLCEELGDDPRRVWGWAFSQNVVSLIWDEWNRECGMLRFLEALWALKGSYWRCS